ncbi:MAG: GGDEF domain-containing protein [Acidobacteriota bacterium]
MFSSMALVAGRTADLWERLWVAPDFAYAHVGAAGELLVARVRAVIGLLILIIPAVGVVLQPTVVLRVAFVLVALTLLQTLIVYQVLRRNGHLPGLGFVSSLLDVTLVSAGLVVAARSDAVTGGSAEGIAFLIYFLAIFATSLRFDARVCLVTGAAAVVQYTLLAVFLPSMSLASAADSSLFGSWLVHVARGVLLTAATFLASALVLRGRALRRLSIRDPLTGVMSRGFFEERLAEDAPRIEQRRDVAVCAMLDIDHFKAFNDQHGHSAGDQALRVIGSVLRASFRSSDIVARYGGEEFTVIVVGLDPVLALGRMEAIRRTVAESPVSLRGGRSAPMTVSIGVACFPVDGSSLQAVLAQADDRLYQAKAAGRNRVEGPTLDTLRSL